MAEHRRFIFHGGQRSPQTGGEESLAQRAFRESLATAESFADGSHGSGEIVALKYVRPNGVGRHILESPRNPAKTIELPSHPGAQGYTPGQYVLTAQQRTGGAVIAPPPGAQKGVSQYETTKRIASVDLVMIESASPATIGVGRTISVTLVGVGFSSSPVDTFTAVKFDDTAPNKPWIADPLITVTSPAWVSATEVTVTVAAGSGAPVGHVVNIEVSRT